MVDRAYRARDKSSHFFEYPTVRSFATYLLGDIHRSSKRKHSAKKRCAAARQRCAESLRTKPFEDPREHPSSAAAAKVLPASTSRSVGASGENPGHPLRRGARADRDHPEWRLLSGRAGTWRPLGQPRDGKDSITEIPKPLNWREIYGDPSEEANKTLIKWGGFVDAAEEFDPLFFQHLRARRGRWTRSSGC